MAVSGVPFSANTFLRTMYCDIGMLPPAGLIEEAMAEDPERAKESGRILKEKLAERDRYIDWLLSC